MKALLITLLLIFYMNVSSFSQNQNQATGTIIWYNSGQGFGLISTTEGNTCLICFSEYNKLLSQEDFLNKLTEEGLYNIILTFDIAIINKKITAINIKVKDGTK